MAEIKPEIKVDPGDSPVKLADVDEFEDDTDLHIPPLDSSSSAWLVKASEDLWAAWNELYKNTPEGQDIEVGKLRVYHLKDNQDSSQQRVQMVLHNEIEQHKIIPKVWNLEVKAHGYNNTVVFSEKDLPGHRAQRFGGGRNLGAGKPSGLQVKNERYGQQQRRPGSYRTAIPKQTALAPVILQEAVAKPVEDEASLDMFKKQYESAMNAGRKVTYSNKIEKGRAHPGLASTFTFGSITSRPGKGNKKKQPKEKAVRISREELLDRLQGCFQRYTYWSLKALRNELHQPEAFIKEVLEEIAVLIRSGSFAGNYKLNENTARLLNMSNAQLKEEAAPVKNENDSDGGTGDEMGDGDDDDVDFEDVEMGST